jgi:hypothetical protein
MRTRYPLPRSRPQEHRTLRTWWRLRADHPCLASFIDEQIYRTQTSDELHGGSQRQKRELDKTKLSRIDWSRVDAIHPPRGWYSSNRFPFGDRAPPHENSMHLQKPPSKVQLDHSEHLAEIERRMREHLQLSTSSKFNVKLTADYHLRLGHLVGERIRWLH